MVHSMTGYGKAEVNINTEKYIVEIRSLNGKTSDISIKSHIIPRDKEVLVRQKIASSLVRGNIDLFITTENLSTTSKQINKDVIMDYYSQVSDILDEMDSLPNKFELNNNSSTIDVLSLILRMPEVIENKKNEITDEVWEKIFSCIGEALDNLNNFRKTEGEILHRDLSERLQLIQNNLDEICKFEEERVSAIKERLKAKISELEGKDDNRFEQEIIYYLEKLDINEEKVRLNQHCKYFFETLNTEEYPGKKLGFIAQEMGREINTIGSKANNANIQRCVVQMKNELEKIKEQSLNIL